MDNDTALAMSLCTEIMNVTTLNEIQLIVSIELRQAFLAVNMAALGSIISFFGIFANLINIIVFVKQGLEDATNVTLLALAVSDMAASASLLWMCLAVNIVLFKKFGHISIGRVSFLTGGMPHMMMVRISSWLTAFATIERCFCVVAPLKVKLVLTARRVKVIVCAIFIVVAVFMIPTFYAFRLDWKFYPEHNRSLIGIVYTDRGEMIYQISLLINNVVSPISCFIIMSSSTVTLVVKLNQQSKWRQNVAARINNERDLVSVRDTKVSKLVVVIAAIFIVCLLPKVVQSVPGSFYNEFSLMGHYSNLFQLVATFGVAFEGASSGVNIFIYFKMSSKYKRTFLSLFRKDTISMRQRTS